MENQVKISLFLIVLSLFCSAVAAADLTVHVFEIHHRDAIEVKNKIVPFLTKNDTVVVDQNKIIIKTTAKNAKTIQTIINSLDVAKKQLQFTVYYGDNPENNAQIIATGNREDNNIRLLRVEDEEIVLLTANKLVKLTTAVAGSIQSLHTKEYRDLTATLTKSDIAREIAELVVDVRKDQQTIAELTKKLKVEKDEVEKSRLQEELNTAKDNLFNQQKNLTGLQEKQKLLSNEDKKDIKKQKDYQSRAGSIEQEFITLPAGIYIKPKVLNAQTVRLNIRLQTHSNDPASGQQINQMQTTMQTPIGKWVEISKTEGQSAIRSQNKSYSISTKHDMQQRQIWLKVELLHDGAMPSSAN